MKKTIKLLLTLFAVMLITGISFSVSDNNFVPYASAGVVSSGSCGSNLTYTLDSDGKLTISGSGSMTDYLYTSRPWTSYASSIKTVVISEGVTSIGYGAFKECTKLQSVSIADSVMSVGTDAFLNCSSLKTIRIPKGVTSISRSPFVLCSSLQSITVDPANMYFSNDSHGVLFNKDKTELICYPAGNTATSYAIPTGVKTIGYEAFHRCLLQTITIPDTVTVIGERSFLQSVNLQSVILPDSVTAIGNGAFIECKKLQNIRFSDNLTSIGNDAFYYCTGLKTIELPGKLTKISDNAFYRCTGLQNVTISDGVTSIGSLAFLDCTGLQSVTIPGTVTSIGDSAFNRCSSLADVYYGGTKEEWEAVTIEDYNDPLKVATIHYQDADKASSIGDLDGNGTVTAADARLALRASVGLENLSDAQKDIADIDSNGTITAADARLILRASVGLEDLKKYKK